MLPNQILGIPIVEEAAPGNFAAQQEREFYSQIQVAIDMLRCPSCGSLNYQTTLFVFSTGVEKMVECRNCGNVHEEMFDDKIKEVSCIILGRASSSADNLNGAFDRMSE